MTLSSVNRTYRLDSPPIMQGLFVPIACVGSGDPVRVLRLYTMNTLDTLWSIYCWDLCTTCRHRTYVLSYCWMCTGWVLSTTDCRMIAALYCAVPFIVACVDVSRTVFWDRSTPWLHNIPLHKNKSIPTMFSLVTSPSRKSKNQTECMGGNLWCLSFS